jgi:cytochrome P450
MRISEPPVGQRVAVDGIDLTDAGRYQRECQHSVWRTLRQEAPVWWHPPHGARPGLWCLTRYADCNRVIKDHRVFSSQSGTMLDSVGADDPAGGRTISLADPPGHTRMRIDAMRHFSHQVVRRSAADITAAVRDMLAPLRYGPVDFARLVRRLPMLVAGRVLAIPENSWDDIAFWTIAGLTPGDETYAAEAGATHLARTAHHELFARFAPLIQDRRARPGDDLISALATLHAKDPEPELTVLLNCYSFMAGANSTTSYVAGHTLQALIERPAVWQAVADDPGLVTGLVEEGVRWTATPQHMVRKVTMPCRIGDAELRPGDWVCAWLSSANRDESVFDRPYDFDPRRSPNPHLGFGAGPHYCIGAAFSRLLLTTLFTELVTRFERPENTADPIQLRSNWINGMVSMPIATRLRRGAPAPGEATAVSRSNGWS